ncbi:ATP-binding protein, partial [Profundibacterium mesophilum]
NSCPNLRQVRNLRSGENWEGAGQETLTFVRGEASRNAGTGGAGLGLSIAQAIARSHGGTVALGNRAGGGLRATLRLPCGAQEG